MNRHGYPVPGLILNLIHISCPEVIGGKEDTSSNIRVPQFVAVDLFTVKLSDGTTEPWLL